MRLRLKWESLHLAIKIKLNYIFFKSIMILQFVVSFFINDMNNKIWENNKTENYIILQ